MKDLITTIASILIFSLFLMQYVANIKTFTHLIDTEQNLRIISLEGIKAFDNSEKIKERLNDRLEWKTESVSVNKKNETEEYDCYEITVEIPNVTPKIKGIENGNSISYTTKCLIKKNEINNEESDYNDRINTAVNTS